VVGTGVPRAQTTESIERLAAVQLKEVAALERVRQQEAASLATKDEVQTQGPCIYLDPRPIYIEEAQYSDYSVVFLIPGIPQEVILITMTHCTATKIPFM
jgi:hypothetical protein